MASSSTPLPPNSPLPGGTVVSFVPTGEKTKPVPPPKPKTLPTTTSPPISSSTLTISAHDAKTKAPDGSALQGISLSVTEKLGVDLKKYSVGELLVGISGEDLKSNFKKAMKSDDKIASTPLKWLKKGARIGGLALGMTLNFASRIVSCAVSIGATAVVLSALSLAVIFNTSDSTMWKNPREALLLSVGLGAAFGAGCGALVGTFGNSLVKLSLGIETKSDPKADKVKMPKFVQSLKEDFEKSLQHNAVGAAATGFVGLVPVIINPLCWRAAWVKGEPD